MSNYTKINLWELENRSPNNGHGDVMEARFATKALGLEKSGLGLQKVLPGKTIPFKHRHKVQEEIFVCIQGAGVMHLDDERVALNEWDAVRLAPHVVRTITAGEEGCTVLILGAPHTANGDVEFVRGES